MHAGRGAGTDDRRSHLGRLAGRGVRGVRARGDGLAPERLGHHPRQRRVAGIPRHAGSHRCPHLRGRQRPVPQPRRRAVTRADHPPAPEPEAHVNAVIFDLGTTNFKAAVFSPSLEVIAAASLPTPVRRAEANRSEIAPDAFLDAIRQLASRLREAAPQAWRQIARISFASQANTFLLIDPADRPLTPFIVWNDRRAAELPDLADRLKRVHDAGAYAQTGIPQLNCQFTPAKLIWLQQFESDAWRRTARVLLLADYL